MMPQFHFYLPKEMIEKVRARARARGLSISRYVANIVRREFGGEWPEWFFEEVVGGWKGKPLERPSQGKFEKRNEL